jgi:glycerol-3-phosphate acyltransferase PlsY
MWRGILKTVSGSNGDDNNTREKGIDVGIYVALCDFEKHNLSVTLWISFSCESDGMSVRL